MAVIHKVNSDSCVFRKYKAFGIPETLMRNKIDEDLILVLEHRNVTLKTSMRAIAEYKLVYKQLHKNPLPNDNGTTYHWPFYKFEYVSGDDKWLEKLYADFNWSLKK